tara:strand:- start:689 stop:1330 length:642 start_codon:yes stop_codon:yes gene_type:complete
MKTNTLDLRHMDCMELMATYPDDHFALAVVDPPYGINVNVNAMGKRSGRPAKGYKEFAGGDKCAPNKEYFKQLQRVSKDQIIWGANHFIDNLTPFANSPCWIMWDKKISVDMSFASFEMAWTSFKSVSKKFDQAREQIERIHPTQKPVKLYDWIFANYAEKGMKILDTHMGSGSIAIAAHYAGMYLTACELDEDYYKAACERIHRETSQTVFL